MDSSSEKPDSAKTATQPTDHSAAPGAPQQPGAEREIRHPDGRIEHPSVRSEPHVLPLGRIMATIVAVMVTGGILFYFVWIFFVARENQQLAVKASNYPLATAPRMQLPAQPRLVPLDRLTGNESANVYDRELAYENKLNSYGPTDEAGFVHIPIAEAIKMIVPKLPVRSSAAPLDSYKGDGLLDGGEPNSGRVYQKAPP